MLARQAAAALVEVRTCWPWETAATLPSARRHKALRRAPTGGGEGRGHTVAAAGQQLAMTGIPSAYNSLSGGEECVLSLSVSVQLTVERNVLRGRGRRLCNVKRPRRVSQASERTARRYPRRALTRA